MFGYTYACPAVSTQADASLTNIYNFNNAGDVVTMFPLRDWGFGRYGQTVPLDVSEGQLNNFLNRFQTVTGAAYGGELTEDNFQPLLSAIVGEGPEAFNNSHAIQLTVGLAAYFMGRNQSVSWYDFLLKYYPEAKAARAFSIFPSGEFGNLTISGSALSAARPTPIHDPAPCQQKGLPQ